jgi:hypothetical protein
MDSTNPVIGRNNIKKIYPFTTTPHNLALLVEQRTENLFWCWCFRMNMVQMISSMKIRWRRRRLPSSPLPHKKLTCLMIDMCNFTHFCYFTCGLWESVGHSGMANLLVSGELIRTEIDMFPYMMLVQLWRWWTHWQCGSLPQLAHGGSYSWDPLMTFLVIA